MQTIRALVADADVLARRKIASVLEKTAGISCRLSEPNTRQLSFSLTTNPPDVLLLDLEGARADESELFSRIRALAPALPIVVLVSRTRHGAELAIDALLDGAADFITKPEDDVNVLFADAHFTKRLVPIIRNAAGPRSDAIIDRPDDDQTRQPSVFAMGGSSGAIPTLHGIISGLDVPAGNVLIVQHMPRFFTAALADRLSIVSARPVVEASDGALLTSDRIWLAPGGRHLAIRLSGYDRRLHVHSGRREWDCRPSIDALFRSAAETFRGRAAGIILSGGSGDGVRGCRAIIDAGGRILVQNPTTAPVPELPESVISAGLASAVLTPDEIIQAMNQRTSTARIMRPISDRAAKMRNTAVDHD